MAKTELMPMIFFVHIAFTTLQKLHWLTVIIHMIEILCLHFASLLALAEGHYKDYAALDTNYNGGHFK